MQVGVDDGDDHYLSTEYEINNEQSDASFRRGLLQGDIFIDALQYKVLGLVTEDEAENVFNAFFDLKQYLSNSKDSVKSMKITDLVSCGLDDRLLNEVRIFCIQLESMSPTGPISKAKQAVALNNEYPDDFDEIEEEVEGIDDEHELEQEHKITEDNLNKSSSFSRGIKSAPPIKSTNVRSSASSVPRDRAMITSESSTSFQAAIHTAVKNANTSRPSTTGSGSKGPTSGMKPNKDLTSPISHKQQMRRYESPLLSAPRRSDQSSKLEGVNKKILSYAAPHTRPISISSSQGSTCQKAVAESRHKSHDNPPMIPKTNSFVGIENSTEDPIGIGKMPHPKLHEADTGPISIILQMTPQTSSEDDAQFLQRKMYDGGGALKKSVNVASSITDKMRMSKKARKNPAWIRDENYKIGEKIGKGSFGDVYKCMRRDNGVLVAVKQMHISTFGNNEDINNFMSEIELMKDLDKHPNIVQYLGATVDEKCCLVNIFSDWISGGSVQDLLKIYGSFTVGMIRNYTRQILTGLSFLHSYNIQHRDIKGGNILLDKFGVLRLSDFGASSRLQSGKTIDMSQVKGTPFFMAPEMLLDGKSTLKSDIWAVGCTIIQMLTGNPPWQHMNLAVFPVGLMQLATLLKNLVGVPEYIWPEKEPPCPPLLDLLEQCFVKDREQRPLTEVLLQHDFLLEKNDDDMEDSFGSSLAASFKSTSADLDDHNRSDKDLAMLRRQMERVAHGGHDYRPEDIPEGSDLLSTDDDIQIRMNRNKSKELVPSVATPEPSPMKSNTSIKPPSANNPFASKAPTPNRHHQDHVPLISPQMLQPKPSFVSPSRLPCPKYERDVRIDTSIAGGIMISSNLNGDDDEAELIYLPVGLPSTVNDRSVVINSRFNESTDYDDLDDTFDEADIFENQSTKEYFGERSDEMIDPFKPKDRIGR